MNHPSIAPSSDIIAEMAEQAIAEIPPALRRHVAGIAIAVEELADDETLDEMGLESPYDLTGLYAGIPIGERSVMDVARPPDMITLYRQAILLEWIETGDDLKAIVCNVIIHEIAHHFGFTEAQIETLERE